jgi:hypothetical protein
MFLVITFVPFLLFNGLLTALPVVLYNPKEIWGVRAYTIPIEDFFYSFSLLGFNALVYRLVQRRLEAASADVGERGADVKTGGGSQGDRNVDDGGRDG